MLRRPLDRSVSRLRCNSWNSSPPWIMPHSASPALNPPLAGLALPRSYSSSLSVSGQRRQSLPYKGQPPSFTKRQHQGRAEKLPPHRSGARWTYGLGCRARSWEPWRAHLPSLSLFRFTGPRAGTRLENAYFLQLISLDHYVSGPCRPLNRGPQGQMAPI